ncbi:MAG: precorrin-6Y C5,15-methyltransferase (decarboxylating) subunit CbiT [Methanobrevibacter wolinii]|uniref:precorrin-6Y C5,15-methyltransferase (decarboxylating) subunit CbiT n=1 Tax=Methanobrevibacter wolinii TaxID=190977 RepID=UPI0005B2B0C1|nr:precorrin-6Y C5,15-methyltransferase (decarboxylating) subunit CbiT [Methanobrevibacter wolinii]MDD5960565.1 precorrin-6Y C5,15-methyltransferase (decarboxylating) subunit CbiT [Methanobrevibacter wolinii]
MFEDSDFIKNCEVPGPTKEVIRALLVYEADIKKSDVVVDIGCGTGGLTVEFASRAKQVYSIDKNPNAIEVTKANLNKLLKTEENVSLINDDAVNALENIDNIDIAIIGGSGKELYPILDLVDEKLNSKGRIFITAILLDTKVEAIDKLKELGYNPKIMEINVSKGRVLDRGTLMKAENPISIISAHKH